MMNRSGILSPPYEPVSPDMNPLAAVQPPATPTHAARVKPAAAGDMTGPAPACCARGMMLSSGEDVKRTAAQSPTLDTGAPLPMIYASPRDVDVPGAAGPIEEEATMDLSALHGILPPVLTPLHDDETVDTRSLAALLEYLIGAGVHGLWICGTTGEFACLDGAQRAAAVRTAVETARGRLPVVANVGDGSTALAIAHARAAREAGADALALTPPYYYSNNQAELLDHFRALRAAVDLPLLVYNIPQTVKVKLDVPTMVTLANEGTVVGLKDSQNDLDWFRSVIVNTRARRPDLRAFLGTRALIDAAVLIGGAGSIPGIANIYPRWCVRCHEAAARGDWVEAARYQELVMAGSGVTAVGPGSAIAQSLGGMKAILQAEGIIASRRLAAPLHTPTDAEAEQVVARYRALVAAPAPAD
jgi:4-hydroxy-tetrahydrodipicolinate synthase